MGNAVPKSNTKVIFCLDVTTKRIQIASYEQNLTLCISPKNTVLLGPSTLATLFNHMWPRIVADPSTLGRHVAATCMLCMQTLCLWRGRATACRSLEPQTAVCSPKLENNGFLRE